MKKLCALLLLFIVPTHFLESCFSRKERLGLVEKKVEQKQKTIDSVDHMAALAGLLAFSRAGLSDVSFASAKKEVRLYDQYVSCLASGLISENSVHVFSLTDTIDSLYRLDMLVYHESTSLDPQNLDKVENYKFGEAHKIADFDMLQMLHKHTAKLFIKISTSETVPSFYKINRSVEKTYKVAVLQPFDVSQGIAFTTISNDGLECRYDIKKERFFASKPVDRMCYPDHTIVIKARTLGFSKSSVKIYAIPKNPRYKDKYV